MPEPTAENPAAGPPLRRRAFLGTVAAGGAAAAGLAAAGPPAAAVPAGPDRTPGRGGRHRRRFRFGGNYVPSKKWWFSWSDWDRRSI
ncbi:MAG: hypothetical protein ACJ73S_17445, partial [Mycobacteriales bacterium]